MVVSIFAAFIIIGWICGFASYKISVFYLDREIDNPYAEVVAVDQSFGFMSINWN